MFWCDALCNYMSYSLLLCPKYFYSVPNIFTLSQIFLQLGEIEFWTNLSNRVVKYILVDFRSDSK